MTVRLLVPRFLVAAALLVPALAASLPAQEPAARRERLRQEVTERFIRNFQAQAGLTEEQSEQFHGVLRQSFQAHAELQRRERQAWMALEGQMRPGIAADADSVTVLLDVLVQTGADRVQQMRTDQQAYAEFLSPVQRAQLTIAWRRLQNQIQRMQQRRGPGMN